MEFEAKAVFLVSPAMAESHNDNWHAGHNFCSGYCDIALLQRWRAANTKAPCHKLAGLCA
jgi:hypothetical protein